MKTLSVLFLITSFISSTAVIANEFTNISSKDPNAQDISVDKLVNYNCGRSGYFNPVVCEEDVMLTPKGLEICSDVNLE